MATTFRSSGWKPTTNQTSSAIIFASRSQFGKLASISKGDETKKSLRIERGGGWRIDSTASDDREAEVTGSE